MILFQQIRIFSISFYLKSAFLVVNATFTSYWLTFASEMCLYLIYIFLHQRVSKKGQTKKATAKQKKAAILEEDEEDAEFCVPAKPQKRASVCIELFLQVTTISISYHYVGFTPLHQSLQK